MGDFAYDTLLRYALNSIFSIAAGYFGLNATQVQTGENLICAALSALIAATVWAWGIWRSSHQQKLLDVASSPATKSSVKTAIIVANPGLIDKMKDSSR